MAEKKEKLIGFTFRISAREMAVFNAICVLKGDTAADLFRTYVRNYIEQNKNLVNLDAIANLKEK